MTRQDAEETLHHASEYLSPTAYEWLYSEEQPDIDSGVWDAYFMLSERLVEMAAYDERGGW